MKIQQDILIIGMLFPAIPLTMRLRLLFTSEIQIATAALGVHLSELGSNQELEGYWKLKRRCRNALKQ